MKFHEQEAPQADGFIPSRRDFLKRAGVGAAGVALATSGLSLFTGCEKKYETTYAPKQELSYKFIEKKGTAAAPYPYPYQKLDPTTCAERAYAAYQQKGG
ncbi:hypothetical protein ABB02_00362 [Clostridiaceae bacterium JG1575]|nr:hypothetical protein ABB02_00362 [Clostridiaceae bacterium JG1575]